MHERDAVLDRADEHAQIATDALGLVDDELAFAVDAGENRLVRSILANDVATAAFDAEILIDLGLDDVIEIEMLPVRDRRQTAAVMDVQREPSRAA